MSGAPVDRTVARPHVVILGGGFGGLHCARALRRAPVDVTLVDRRNHHLFQPLLYQVATASLSPADVASPIRAILKRARNVHVWLGEAVDVDVDSRVVHLDDGRLPYDYLVIATGVTHAYFGHDEWAADAPGLKTVDDALEIRRRFLPAARGDRPRRQAHPRAPAFAVLQLLEALRVARLQRRLRLHLEGEEAVAVHLLHGRILVGHEIFRRLETAHEPHVARRRTGRRPVRT